MFIQMAIHFPFVETTRHPILVIAFSTAAAILVRRFCYGGMPRPGEWPALMLGASLLSGAVLRWAYEVAMPPGTLMAEWRTAGRVATLVPGYLAVGGELVDRRPDRPCLAVMLRPLFRLGPKRSGSPPRCGCSCADRSTSISSSAMGPSATITPARA